MHFPTSKTFALFLPAVATAISLSDFTPRASDLTKQCFTRYTSTIPGCSPLDFNAPSPDTAPSCSTSCISALVTLNTQIYDQCGGAPGDDITNNQNAQGLIKAFLEGQGIQAICPNVAVVTTGSGNNPQPTSTAPPSSESDPDTSTAAPTSTTDTPQSTVPESVTGTGLGGGPPSTLKSLPTSLPTSLVVFTPTSSGGDGSASATTTENSVPSSTGSSMTVTTIPPSSTGASGTGDGSASSGVTSGATPSGPSSSATTSSGGAAATVGCSGGENSLPADYSCSSGAVSMKVSVLGSGMTVIWTCLLAWV